MIQTAIFLAEGFEEVEALTVVDILRRAGIDIKMVSITEQLAVTGSHKITVEADMLLKDVNFDMLSLIILPGGSPGYHNLSKNQTLMDALKLFYEKDKNIAAICGAPGVLGQLGILQGKTACCYPGHEKELIGAKVSFACVVRDGNILTSRSMGTSIAFALAIVSDIKGKKAAEDIAAEIVYKE